MKATIEELKQRIAEAKNIVVLTGAGISAESGVPTFRDALTGLWEQFDPSELATPEAFLRDKALVWGWYEWRRKLLLKAKPNPAHIAIAELQKRHENFTLITQNVDDLHEQAGSKDVLHVHGSIYKPHCFSCEEPYTFTEPPTIEKEQSLQPPKCTRCSGSIRPGVVWFGEMLPIKVLKHSVEAIDACDLLLSIGTSGLVYPVAVFPERASENGATVIHINLEPFETRYPKSYVVQGKAGEVLPLLI